MSWKEDALCKGTPTELYYPERRNLLAAELAELCYSCPVIVPCRAHGIKHETFGVWGGLNARERITERRKNGITATNIEMPYLRQLQYQQRPGTPEEESFTSTPGGVS